MTSQSAVFSRIYRLTNSPQTRLDQVAQRVARILDIEQRRVLASCAGLLAGLRFEADWLRQLFRE